MVKIINFLATLLLSLAIMACSPPASSEGSSLPTINIGGVNYFPACLDAAKKSRCLSVTVDVKNARLKDFLGRQSVKSFAKEQGIPESSINENTPLPAGKYMVAS